MAFWEGSCLNEKIDIQFMLWIVQMSPYQKAMDLPNKNIGDVTVDVTPKRIR